MAMEIMLYPTSSLIRRTGYDSSSQELVIQYRTGDQPCYLYESVSPGVHDNMKKASSVGSYVNTQIKGKYTFKPISNPF